MQPRLHKTSNALWSDGNWLLKLLSYGTELLAPTPPSANGWADNEEMPARLQATVPGISSPGSLTICINVCLTNQEPSYILIAFAGGLTWLMGQQDWQRCFWAVSFVLQQSPTLREKKKKSFGRRVCPFPNLLEIMSQISVQPGPCIAPVQDFSAGAG